MKVTKETIAIFNYISLGVTAFLISFAITPLIRYLSIKFKFIDKPDHERKLHKQNKALLGGIGIYFAFLISMIYAYNSLPVFQEVLSQSNFNGLIIGTFLMMLIGLLDDIYNLTAFFKLFLQIVPAVILYYYDFKINLITNPFTGEPLELNNIISLFLTLGWILTLTNAINLIDGMDGLATGISIIGCITLFIIALNRGNEDITSAILTVCLLGACSGFMKYNFPPASIFMGDTGSLFIGFTMAAIGILGFNKSTTAVALMVPIAAVGIPIYDTFLAVIRRSRRGTKLFSADSEHIHHRLLKMGFSNRQTLLLLYGLSIYFGVIAYAFLKIPNQMSFLLLIFFLLSIFILATYLRKKEVKVFIRKKENNVIKK